MATFAPYNGLQTLSKNKKVKVRPRTGQEGPQKNYSTIISLTSALDRGLRLTPRAGRFAPGKETR